MALLTKQQIFAVAPPFVEVDVSAWGGSVRLTAMTLKRRNAFYDVWSAASNAQAEYERDQDRDEADRENLAAPKPLDEGVMTLIFAMTDEDGEPIFTVEDHDDIADLPLLALTQLLDANAKLNAAQPAPVPLETLKKN